MNAAAGAELIGKVRVVAQRMAGGMSAADLRSLVGDIRGKLGADPAVVALIAEGDDDAVPVRGGGQRGRTGPRAVGQRSGQAAWCGR